MSQITVKGGCLCGSVQYEVTGETKRFYHCHCERCRKATGTGHAVMIYRCLQSIRRMHNFRAKRQMLSRSKVG